MTFRSRLGSVGWFSLQLTFCLFLVETGDGFPSAYAVSLTPVGGISIPSFGVTGASRSAHSSTVSYGVFVNNRIIRGLEIEWGVLYAPRGFVDKDVATQLTFYSL